MLAPEQIEFYERWNAKADLVEINSVENCIDKYITLFITYNSLYNIVPIEVARITGNPAKNSGDKISATENIVNFLTPSSILANLTKNNNDKDVAALQRVMSQTIFNIKLDPQGNPQPATEGQLTTDLLSPNQKVKSLALLQVLYYIRCNIVHGRKGLQSYQIILLQPVINILSTINRQLFASLRDYPLRHSHACL